MPQSIRCPNPQCQQVMQVPDNAAGRNVLCPKCKKPFTVPPPGDLVGAGVGASPPSRGAAAAGPASRGSINLPSVPPAAAPGAPPAAGSTTCPACGSSQIPLGAIACMDCGFLLQGDAATVEPE